jgi:lipopolysaccharide export system permease protein
MQLFSENKMMKNIPELTAFVDSLHRQLRKERRQTGSQLNPYFLYQRFDTTGQGYMKRFATLKVPPTKLPSLNATMVETANNRARNVRAFMSSYSERVASTAREAGNYRIEIFKKYTQSAAILVMFLIGAPLGSIIKKGGLGVPVLVSVLFFIIYYIFSILGEKYGREAVMPVGIGMWMANFALLPAGLFFLYQARRDSSLFEIDFWVRLSRRLPKWFGKRTEPVAG